jgi:hypothetical protein
VFDTEHLVRKNIARGDVFVVPHAARQIKQRRISLDHIIATAMVGEVIERYPHDDDGPALLLLQWIANEPLHVVWRIEAATAGPALIVTAYRPNPTQWSADFRRRLSPEAVMPPPAVSRSHPK